MEHTMPNYMSYLTNTDDSCHNKQSSNKQFPPTLLVILLLITRHSEESY